MNSISYDPRSPSPVVVRRSVGDDCSPVVGVSRDQKAVTINGAREVSSPYDSGDPHRLCVVLPGDRAAVSRKQPESRSPNAVDTLDLDGDDSPALTLTAQLRQLGDEEHHKGSWRSSTSSAEVAAAASAAAAAATTAAIAATTAAIAVAEAALARGSSAPRSSPISKRPPRAGKACRPSLGGTGADTSPLANVNAMQRGEGEAEPRKSKSAPPCRLINRRASAPSLMLRPPAPPRSYQVSDQVPDRVPDQVPAQRRQSLPAMLPMNTRSPPEQHLSQEVSAHFREMDCLTHLLTYLRTYVLPSFLTYLLTYLLALTCT